jgi:uncharacterized membrane protein YsdA (DUF1294 family)
VPVTAAVAIALGVVNLFALALYGVDKGLARAGARRISERTLLGAAALGGAAGAWLGMLAFRHKTQKARFRFGVPLLALGEAALAVWLFVRSR